MGSCRRGRGEGAAEQRDAEQGRTERARRLGPSSTVLPQGVRVRGQSKAINKN